MSASHKAFTIKIPGFLHPIVCAADASANPLPIILSILHETKSFQSLKNLAELGDVNAEDCLQKTALCYAVEKSTSKIDFHTENILKLLEFHADPIHASVKRAIAENKSLNENVATLLKDWQIEHDAKNKKINYAQIALFCEENKIGSAQKWRLLSAQNAGQWGEQWGGQGMMWDYITALNFQNVDSQSIALYWLEKQYLLWKTEKDQAEVLFTFSKRVKDPTDMLSFNHHMMLSRLYLRKKGPNKNLFYNELKALEQLLKAKAIFLKNQEQFKTESIIQLNKLLAELAILTTPDPALNHLKISAELGDLYAAECGAELALELKKPDEACFFYTKTIDNANKMEYFELVNRVKTKMLGLSQPGEVKKIEKMNHKEEPAELFNQAEELLIKKIIPKQIEESKEPNLFIKILNLLPQYVGIKSAKACEFIEAQLSKEEVLLDLKVESLFDVATDIELRKRLTVKAKELLVGKKAEKLAEIYFLESQTVHLQLSKEEKLASLVKAESLYAELLQTSIKKSDALSAPAQEYALKLQKIKSIHAAIQLEKVQEQKRGKSEEKDILTTFATAQYTAKLSVALKSSTAKEGCELLNELLLASKNQLEKINEVKEYVLILIKGTACWKEILSYLFQSVPEDTLLAREKLIQSLKTSLATEESFESATQLQFLLSLMCNTPTRALRVTSNRAPLLQKQAEIVYRGVKEAKSQIEYISDMQAIVKEAKESNHSELFNFANRVLNIINYQAALSESNVENRKNKLQQLAQAGIFPAVSDLEKIFETEKNWRGHPKIGRRLFLCTYAMLLKDKVKEEFPTFPVEIELKAKRAFLEETTRTYVKKEQALLARWYITLIDKIIPALTSHSPANQVMNALLASDPLAFLLHAPHVYALHFNFSAEELKTISELILQDMGNAVGKNIATEKLKQKPNLQQTKIEEVKSVVKETKSSEDPMLQQALKASLEVHARPLVESKEVFSPKITGDLYVATLALLSIHSHQNEILTEQKKLLAQYVVPVGRKDPIFGYYVLASWYNQLINFIAPEIRQSSADQSAAANALRKNKLDEFLKLAPQHYSNYMQLSGFTQDDIKNYVFPALKHGEAAIAAIGQASAPLVMVPPSAPSFHGIPGGPALFSPRAASQKSEDPEISAVFNFFNQHSSHS